MKTAIEQIRRGASFDFKLHKQPMTALVLTIFSLYIVSIIMGDRPRTVYYYSEMGMFPLVIIITLLLFQREIGGGSMEMIATYPISIRLMAVRKWILALLYTSLLNVGWMVAYKLKFENIKTVMHRWDGGDAINRMTGMFPLMLQNLPAMMLLTSVTLFGIVLFRKTYGGLALGFTLWMLDTISGGEWLSRWTLYASYFPEGTSFVMNRVLMLTAAVCLLCCSVWLLGRRERWIVEEEE